MASDVIRTERAERRQVAALPWRRGSDGRVEVLLITSRETRRWVTPKGGRMSGKTDGQAAAQEAWEEAGVRGPAEEKPLGAFRYLKRLKGGGSRWCVVSLHAMAVETVEDHWPEDHQRERRWVSPQEAARMVDEPDLAVLLAAFPDVVAGG